MSAATADATPTVAVQLRPMRWWDVPAARALEVGLFPDAWSEPVFWSELAGVPASRYYLVATASDDVLGYAGLSSIGAEADVQTVAVAPATQGTGLGGRLLDALLVEARARGCTRVTLEVRADNVSAQRLYERRGFERIAVRRRYYEPDGADAHVMQLKLSPPAAVTVPYGQKSDRSGPQSVEGGVA